MHFVGHSHLLIGRCASFLMPPLRNCFTQQSEVNKNFPGEEHGAMVKSSDLQTASPLTPVCVHSDPHLIRVAFF